MSPSDSAAVMPPLKAIIFDAFETLYSNSSEQWRRTFEEVCEDLALLIDPQELRRCWVQFEGEFRRRRTRMDDPASSPPFITYREAWRSAFEQAFEQLGLNGYANIAAAIAVRNMGLRPPYEDATSTLPMLRKGPWKLGLLSNADDDFLTPVLETWPLASFDAILSSESAAVYKPHPKAFQAVLEKLNVAPQEAIYIGDQLYDDVHGSKLVGMRAVWLNRTGQTERNTTFEVPDFEISNLVELPKLVESLTENGSNA